MSHQNQQQQQATPPLLLTKRLTTFLTTSLTPQLHTLLLATSTGKLLAHASKPLRPVSELRAQSTVASSLVSLHASSGPSIPGALGHAGSPPVTPSSGGTLRDDDDDKNDQDNNSSSTTPSPTTTTSSPSRWSAGPKPAGITVQLSGGVVVVRRLKCGLLFVCVGPVVAEARGREAAVAGGNQTAVETIGAAAATTTTTSSLSVSGSPDEGDSVLSAAGSSVSAASARAQGVVAMKRQAEELARILDDKLGSLKVPEDGVVGAE